MTVMNNHYCLVHHNEMALTIMDSIPSHLGPLKMNGAENTGLLMYIVFQIS